jgi:hypothetical protein
VKEKISFAFSSRESSGESGSLSSFDQKKMAAAAAISSLDPAHVVAGAGHGQPNTFACGVLYSQTIIVRQLFFIFFLFDY